MVRARCSAACLEGKAVVVAMLSRFGAGLRAGAEDARLAKEGSISFWGTAGQGIVQVGLCPATDRMARSNHGRNRETPHKRKNARDRVTAYRAGIAAKCRLRDRTCGFFPFEAGVVRARFVA